MSARLQIMVPAEKVPVVEEADIVVIGGSCTGVFAAVRAARLGARVVIVEKLNRFGGVATSGLVNMWHSIYDTDYNRQIIGGLTHEIMERLDKRNMISRFKNSKDYAIRFNSEELTIELDELVLEEKIKPYLHTFFAAPVIENGQVSSVIIQNKSGRSAIKGGMFIDATGDADLCFLAGLPTYIPPHIQPPTTCAKFTHWNIKLNANKLIMKHAAEFNLPEGYMWGAPIPPDNDVFMLAGTRVSGKNPADGKQLTFCEMEGRRQVRAVMDIWRKYAPGKSLALHALPSQIGIRESRHIKGVYRIAGTDLLDGKKFDDAIANGTYPVDIHHQDKPGITFKELNGTQCYCRPGKKAVVSRWRKKTANCPKYYQIPLRSLIPQNSKNVIAAGRMLDADREAFGAVRVMVNLNQTGEAAGVAAWHALQSGINIARVNARDVRKSLLSGGSCIF
ncbi:MAG: FAD-dependent oxidoreductase [Verrucomicrobiota bacterium]